MYQSALLYSLQIWFYTVRIYHAMKLRLVFCFMLIGHLSAQGQQADIDLADSTLLEPVTVYGLPEEKYLTGATMYSVDSSLLQLQASQPLNETLVYTQPVYFRTYGSGMSSGISLRGTSPNHTAVLWNGLSINSFSLGQADFSTLPGVAFSSVKVHEGGGSARYGSGAFGGTVLLATDPAPKNHVTLLQEVGSFQRHFTALKGQASWGKLSTATGLYRLTSDNNFPIPGSDERQQHAAYKQQGILHDMTYRWSAAKSLCLHYWYHNADREIQPTIGQSNSQNEQQDRNHRLQLIYNVHNAAGIFKVNAGLVDDVIVYNGSESRIFRVATGADHQYTFTNGLHTQIGTHWNQITAWITGYDGGKADEYRGDVFASAQKDISPRLSAAINIRQPIIENITSPFLPYLGATYTLIQKEHQALQLQGNVSKNFRVPTFNDRYWQDVGSLTLRPETSYAAEAGLHWLLAHTTLSTTFFTQQVTDWIQWVPDANGTYRPRNVKEVRAQGIEAVAETTLTPHADIETMVRITYQLTESITTKAPSTEAYTIGKQLIYTPRHNASGYLHAQWKQWNATITSQYSGKRYTDSSNTDLYALDAFVLTDVSLGHSFSVQKHRLDLQFTVKNITDTAYLLYAGRAQPGRHYNAQLSYRLDP